MSPTSQNQLNFQCRKSGVRRKMDFDPDLTSPTKSPRKEICCLVEGSEIPNRLTRSSSRRASHRPTTQPRVTCSQPDGDENRVVPQLGDVSTSPRKLRLSEASELRSSPRKLQVLQLCDTRSSPRKQIVQQQPEVKASPKKLQLQQQSVSSFFKARQALHTSVPSTIFGREKELAQIGDFLQPLIDGKKPGSMYISGRPGTGKTACVTHTLANRTFANPFKTIFINCMLLPSPSAVYQYIAQQLDPKWSAKDALVFLKEKLTEHGPMMVLVLDEIDQMATRDQSVLYTLFELPALRNSRLILIGLANALDLTDRALVRLQSRVHFKPTLLNFPPYSKQEIASILSQRIREALNDDVNSVIAPSALQYLGSKISASSGDLRKAIDVCRRAVELAENAAKKQMVLAPSETNTAESTAKCVNIPLICKMMASVESNRFCAGDNGNDADDTPLQQKLIVSTLLVLVKHGKSKQVTLGQLHQSYNRVCAKFGVTAMDFDEFANTCTLVESRGIVALKQKGNVRLTPISLRLDEREVETTLRDKTLLSSILAQGSLFV